VRLVKLFPRGLSAFLDDPPQSFLCSSASVQAAGNSAPPNKRAGYAEIPSTMFHSWGKMTSEHCPDGPGFTPKKAEGPFTEVLETCRAGPPGC
jgi:hypothetical protein